MIESGVLLAKSVQRLAVVRRQGTLMSLECDQHPLPACQHLRQERFERAEARNIGQEEERLEPSRRHATPTLQ